MPFTILQVKEGKRTQRPEINIFASPNNSNWLPENNANQPGGYQVNNEGKELDEHGDICISGSYNCIEHNIHERE